MSEIERSVNYAKKRSQALRNCESHLQTILFDVAKKIVSASKNIGKGGGSEMSPPSYLTQRTLPQQLLMT